MERVEKLATPLTAATVSVPDSVPPPGLVPIATVTLAVELVTVLPNASCTATCTAGTIATPAGGVAAVERDDDREQPRARRREDEIQPEREQHKTHVAQRRDDRVERKREAHRRHAGHQEDEHRDRLELVQECGHVRCCGRLLRRPQRELAFARAKLDWRKHVKLDKRYLRPAEVDHLCGDAGKARKQLGWKPRVNFQELVSIMVDADVEVMATGRDDFRSEERWFK